MPRRYAKELSIDELANLPDAEIDTSDIPELDDAFFRHANLVLPQPTPKQSVTLRLDQDVLAWFKSQGKGHLTRMNAVLRAYMLTQRSQ